MLYYNKKAIITIQSEPNSRIVSYNLPVYEQIILATATLCVLLEDNCKRNNLSYKAKDELVTYIVKALCEKVGVDININKED